jgi:AbrB family looped-hinge helix DNA binding protein
MQKVKVSKKFQIAIPAEVRRQLGIKQGDELVIDVEGKHALLMRVPESHAADLAGLHADVWAGVDPDEYVRREREAWTD